METTNEDTARLSVALDELKATVARLQEHVRAVERGNAALFGLALGVVANLAAKPDEPFIGRAEIESALIRMAGYKSNPVLSDMAAALLDIYRGGHFKEPERAVARHLRLVKSDIADPAADPTTPPDDAA